MSKERYATETTENTTPLLPSTYNKEASWNLIIPTPHPLQWFSNSTNNQLTK